MRRFPAAPALLLAAWLLPLAAQAGALLHLLDSGEREHPPSMIELFVHGHTHPGRVPVHEHSVREAPAVRAAMPRPAERSAAGEASAAHQATVIAVLPGRFAPADRALEAAPPRHLLLVALLR